MIQARVDGYIVTHACHPSLQGFRSIICQPLSETGDDEGNPVLAIDPLGAGLHQRVVVSTDGSRTRDRVGDPKSPLRNMIVALVDDPIAVAPAK